MAGLGTIINVAGILAGGFLGMLFGRFLTERVQDTVLKANGLCVMFLGIGGTMEKMLAVSEGKLSGSGSMMMIMSFAFGSLLGEWIDLDGKMERFGEWLKVRTGNAKDAGFVNAFVTASLTVCIGAMAVVGSIQDGIDHNISVLAAKAVLDLIIIMVMTSSMGKGCLFSAIPVAIFQGSITLLARLIEPFLTEQALHNLSFTGNMMIFCVGVNLIWGKKFKVANFLPALIIAVIWSFFG